MRGYRAPTLGAKSFSCPHCGALAHQTWYTLRPHSCSDGQAPHLYSREEEDGIANSRELDQPTKETLARYFNNLRSKKIFLDSANYEISDYTVGNLHLSRCYGCSDYAVWVAEALVFPATAFESMRPAEDMPPEIAADFAEAAQILLISPRGAAALLRLAIQKLCQHVGETGKTIDQNIASLVSKGLDTRIQRALDVVRVIGNEAVHPGQIDLKDDIETARRLFQLVNLITEAMISAPARLNAMYEGLPPEKLQGIEQRDRKA